MIQQMGKYQLLRKLATGGMAEVFLAKAAGPMGFEKTLVLKRILPYLAEEPTFVEMFLGEARLAAWLNHPNIVQIFDFGEADGTWFLAMEYIDGPNLRVLIKRASALGLALPPTLCARIIANACEGLAFAHGFRNPQTGEPLGLIHRDISPDNILLSRQGTVKVVDFGIAKAAGQSHKTQSGLIKGKLSYMPPEQIQGRKLDQRLDVYALGVVFYELLTSCKPFTAADEASLMQAILFQPFVPAVKIRPELPTEVQRILDRTLAKDRESRYPDCTALQADLEEFILASGKPVPNHHVAHLISQLSGEPLPQHIQVTAPSQATVPARRSASSKPGAKARQRLAAAGAVLIMLGGGVLSWRLGAQEQLEPPDEPFAPAETSTLPPILNTEPVPGPERPLQQTTGSERQRKQTGIIEFQVKPSAIVYLEGERLGMTPLPPVEIQAGKYALRFVNQDLGKDMTASVDVKAEQVAYVQVDLLKEEDMP